MVAVGALGWRCPCVHPSVSERNSLTTQLSLMSAIFSLNTRLFKNQEYFSSIFESRVVGAMDSPRVPSQNTVNILSSSGVMFRFAKGTERKSRNFEKSVGKNRGVRLSFCRSVRLFIVIIIFTLPDFKVLRVRHSIAS